MNALLCKLQNLPLIHSLLREFCSPVVRTPCRVQPLVGELSSQNSCGHKLKKKNLLSSLVIKGYCFGKQYLKL